MISETIDISNGTEIKDDVQKKGHIYYEGVYYSPKYYTHYNYKIVNDTKVDSNMHPRGCVCHLKQCILTCCPPGQVRKVDESGCFDYPDQEFYVNFTLPDGTISTEELNRTHYGFIQKLPCKRIQRLENDQFNDESWQFFKVTVSVAVCLLLPETNLCSAPDFNFSEYLN